MASDTTEQATMARRGGRVHATIGAAVLTAGAIAYAAAGWSSAEAVTLFQKSAYTTIDVKTCTPIEVAGGNHAFRCPGLDDVPAYFAEGGGRAFVSAGETPEATRAAATTLKPYNTPFAAGLERAILEWRFVIRDNRKVPYAIIVRFFTHDDAATGEVLVVIKIAGTQACHMAYVDARANQDAIVLARRIADQRARSFDCSKPATVEGLRGSSPM